MSDNTPPADQNAPILPEEALWAHVFPSREVEQEVIDILKSHPELGGRILYDPTEPATEEDWPEARR